MRTNKKVMTGALLLFMLLAANFQNALNDYGIRSNAFMNGVIASGSNGSGTERACNENGTSYFFFCTKDVNPEDCTLYKDLHAGAGAQWTSNEIGGKINVDFIKKTGAKNICDGNGTGCFLFTCMEVNPPQPQ